MDSTLTPGTLLGPYQIEALIGSGGMGHVYRALDPRLGRHVAIKTLPAAMVSDPVLARRFESEARTVGALDHPNLLVVYDVGRAGDMPYIVSELLDGETIRDRLCRDGALPARTVAQLAAQIVAGLEAAHTRGIVHRDLKPENLFLTRDRRLKILDFGIAKRVSGSDTATIAAAESLTVTGMIVGTVGYMAPEQLLGENIDARADIFALGVVLHEMLTGTPPFRRATSVATMNATVSDEAPVLPTSVPFAFSRIVQRCLVKSPEDRFHSAHDLAIALDITESTDHAGRASSTPDANPAAGDRSRGAVSRRAAIGYGAAGVLLATSVVGGGMFLRPSAATSSFRRLTFRRGVVRSARVAPDGQTILFGALWDGDACRVHTTRVDGPESRALDLPDANVLAVSRAGELAVALGTHRDGIITYGTLARVPLAGGAPRELITDVKFADWSPDGSELAVIRNVDGRDRLEFPIGRSLVQPRTGEATGLGFVRIAADAQRIAFVQYQAPGSLVGRVCITDRTGKVTSLTPEYLNIHGLAWRGDEIWFTASDDRPLFRALRAVTVGGAPRVVARFPGNVTLWDAFPDGRLLLAQTDDRAVLVARRPGDVADRDLSWLDASWAADISRDGDVILFSETGQGAGPNGGAYLRRIDGSPAVRLALGEGLALSPDGRLALCTPGYTTVVGGTAPYIELVPTGAGETRRIPGNGLLFTGAHWLPDGVGLVVSAMTSGRAPRLYLLSVGGGTPVPMTPEGVEDWAVSPDGATVAVRGVGQGITLHSVANTSSTATSRLIPGTAGGARLIGWVNDGVLILRTDDATAKPGDVWLLDPETGRQSAWANIMPTDGAGIMALISFRVTPDGRSRANTWHRALSDLYLADGLA